MNTKRTFTHTLDEKKDKKGDFFLTIKSVNILLNLGANKEITKKLFRLMYIPNLYSGA